MTGGGTAGHITPNIALLPFLKEFEIHYIGRAASMEEELLRAYPHVIFHAIPAVKLERRLTLKNLLIPFKLNSAKNAAAGILREIKPKVIFSKGGFVALPVMLAAKDIPVILHESDLTMGLANKMAVKKCRYACTSFSSTADKLKNGVCTGAPLRQTLYLGNKLRASVECKLSGRKNLLVFGGSLGSKAINEAVLGALPHLTKLYDVVHITGKNNSKTVSDPRYFSLPFTNNIADYFAWADLVVSRGGANALFELAALKKPALVIPLPKGGSRGDQIDNAEYFKNLGCCRVLPQQNLNPASLVENLALLDNDRFALIENMRNATGIDGTRKIAEMIKSLAAEISKAESFITL